MQRLHAVRGLQQVVLDAPVVHAVAAVGHHPQLHLRPRAVQVECGLHGRHEVQAPLDRDAGDVAQPVNALQRRRELGVRLVVGYEVFMTARGVGDVVHPVNAQHCRRPRA